MRATLKTVPDGSERECLKASHSKNPLGYFLKRLEIHTAFQNSCPRDLCKTFMCVLEYSVYAAPVLGNTCYVGFLHENVIHDCLLYESVANLYYGYFY